MKKYILDDNGYYLGITEHENVTHTKIEEELPELTDIQTAKWDGSKWVVEEDSVKVANKANEWKRNRQMEYPSIQELVVALYDEEDKSAIIEKRNQIKAKYPKLE